MKRVLILVILCVSQFLFAQQVEVKKKQYKKTLEYGLGFNTESFYQGYSEAWVRQATGSVRYIKDEGFKKPLFGFNAFVNKPLNNHVLMGLRIGVGRVKNYRYQGRRKVYFYSYPITFNTTYIYFKKKETLLRPFVTFSGGYSFFHIDTGYPSTRKYSGGIIYGVDLGLRFKSKYSKLLNGISLRIGYNDFITTITHTPEVIPGVYKYRVHRIGIIGGIQYRVPYKKKHKKKH